MCTVTYVRTGDKVVLTSNRDEHRDRPSAEYPRVYSINDKEVTFPRDPQSGGTWFVMDADANVAILLNGAASRHHPGLLYRKSRGLILLDLMTSPSVLTRWSTLSLEGIEPFTIVTYWKTGLYQLRWDSIQKEKLKLNPAQNYMWSSATLYSDDLHAKRLRWFETFLHSSSPIDEECIRHFHLTTESSNREYGLVINRNEQIKTLSLTQAVITSERAKLFHQDLQKDKIPSDSFATT